MSRQKGFTLIELLVAAAILGTVSTALTGVTFSIFHNTDDNNGRVEAVTGIEVAIHQMAKDGMSAQSHDLPPLPGTDNDITLSWMEPDEETPLDVYSYGYDVSYQLIGSDLGRRYLTTQYDGATQINSWWTPPLADPPEVLVSNIKALTFENENDPNDPSLKAFKVEITSTGGGTRISETREYHITLRPDIDYEPPN